MLVAVYENRRYQTFYVPYNKKEELKGLFAEEGIEWYTMCSCQYEIDEENERKKLEHFQKEVERIVGEHDE